MRKWAMAAAIAAAGLAAFAAAVAAPAPRNQVEALRDKLAAGTVRLAYDEAGQGYLPSLLAALSIPAESQVLVFSRGSFQAEQISPQTPRALYFQNDVAVGAVHDGRVLEILVSDPQTGVAFYTLDTARAQRPQLEPGGEACGLCHGLATPLSPGFIVSTHDVRPSGDTVNVDFRNPMPLTDDNTPFEERYGGWYVTGDVGAMRHRGNVVLDMANFRRGMPREAMPMLPVTYDPSLYLSSGSDIVALLVLEHQAGFINRVALLNAQFRQRGAAGATDADIDAGIESLIRYMTFADAAAPPSPVRSGTGFGELFQRQGLRDRAGRSLRDLDLAARVFRYPLTYMIHSDAFDGLNAEARARVWRGLYDALRAAGPQGAAAIEIAAETKDGVPAFWRRGP